MDKGNNMSALNDYVKAKKELVASGRKIIGEAGLALLEKYPELETITFTGYTPSFNDGDPCTFTTGEIYGTPSKLYTDSLKSKEELEQDEEEDEDEYEQEYNEFDCDFEDFLNKKHKSFKKDFQNFVDCIYEMSDLLPGIFDNEYGFKVIISREKLIVEDYDCGY